MLPLLPPSNRFARRSSASLALAASVLALSVPGCAGGKKAGGFQMPPVPVEVAEVRPGIVRDQFRALGTIEADEIVEIVSELNAVVVRLPFREGQGVARGALLAQLEDGEIRGEAERAEAQRELAAANAARGERLSEQQVIAQQELDALKTSQRVARASEEIAKSRLEKTRIRAPFSGVVGRRRVSPGAYLRAGDPITELAGIDNMKVSFGAPERYLGRIRVGSPVTVTTPALLGRLFQGTVIVVDPIVDPASRTFQLVARLPNRDRMLKPGMSANVAVTFAEREQALQVPDEAVFADGEQRFVYVVKPDSTVTRTAVQLGSRDSVQVEVLGGLQAGTRVVRAGHQKLFEGAKVVPVMSASNEKPAAPPPAGRGGS